MRGEGRRRRIAKWLGPRINNRNGTMNMEGLHNTKRWLDIVAKYLFAGMFGLFSFVASQLYYEFKDVIAATRNNAAEIRRVEQKTDQDFGEAQRDIQRIDEVLDAKHEEFLSMDIPH
jgi:hypothetical protein